ncbi:MAG: M28 family peptidase [Acidobacteriota bacterium]
MKYFKIHLPLLFVILFSVAAFAQTAAVANSDAVESGLRKHIEYLASDKLEGRRTGEPGAMLAAKYIESQFTKLKLMPGYDLKKADAERSYLQPYPYVTGVEIAASGNSFRLTANSAPVDGVLAKPVGFSPNSSVENAPVVFAGYGIVSSELKFDDYANLDVTGKVVVIFDGVPDNDNPHGPFYSKFDVRTKALIAKDKGAVGILLISREDKFDDDKLTRLGYDQSLGEAAIPTFVISRNTAWSVLGIDEKGLKFLEQLETAKKDDPADVHINLKDTRPSVSFKVNLVKRSVNAYNVVGILPGNDPVLKNEAIVIGAHYDHLGHGGQGSLAANSTEIHHGADDNASGTAAVIELARQFAKDKNNKRTLIFVCFSGEEEGLFGSNFYVNNPVFPLDKTVAMINMDMIGRLNDNKLTIGGMGTASEWAELIKRNNDFVAGAKSSGIFTLQLNEDGFGPSDHSSFYGKKIPVLFFFTGTHNDYHKPTDTADKINYEGELSVLNYVAAITKAIDQNPQRPTYTVAKSSMTGGRTGFNISLGTIPNYADATDGLLLDGVRDGSPAAKAGVKAGDKVVKLAGHEVRNVMDYTYILGEMKAGEEYEIVVLRGGEKLTMKIVPVKR